ncbi:hypothetical protein MTP99_016543 [Tenebrio molitor]|nr:hypothetical protein MTP99_016543 [Tenebrio molitor]
MLLTRAGLAETRNLAEAHGLPKVKAAPGIFNTLGGLESSARKVKSCRGKSSPLLSPPRQIGPISGSLRSTSDPVSRPTLPSSCCTSSSNFPADS